MSTRPGENGQISPDCRDEVVDTTAGQIPTEEQQRALAQETRDRLEAFLARTDAKKGLPKKQKTRLGA